MEYFFNGKRIGLKAGKDIAKLSRDLAKAKFEGMGRAGPDDARGDEFVRTTVGFNNPITRSFGSAVYADDFH